MKKIYFISGVLLAMASMSCNKDNGVVDTPSGTVLKAVIGTDDTKAAHTHYKDVVWSSGDALAVYNGSDFTQFNLTDGDGTAAGTFTASSDVTPTGFAVYPYAEVKSYDGIKDVTLTLPAEYTWAEQSLNAPMLALVSGSDLATFKQLCGYFKIDVDNLPATASKLVFFTEEQVITGDFDLDVTNAWPGIYNWNVNNEWDRARRTVTVNFTAGEKASRTFYIPVPGGNYTKFKVSIQNAGGEDLITPKTWTASGDPATPVTIDKGTMKVLPAVSCVASAHVVKPIWMGHHDLGNGDNDFTKTAYRGDKIWDTASAGDAVTVHFTAKEDCQIQLNDASWNSFASTSQATAGEYSFSHVLTAGEIAKLQETNEWSQNLGLKINGKNAILTQIEIVSSSVEACRPETVVWTGRVKLGEDESWEVNMTDLDASFWATIPAGKILRLYFEEIEQSWSWRAIQFQYTSSWTTITSAGFNAPGVPFLDYTLTAEDIEHLSAYGSGGVINGEGLILTKITLR